MSLLALLFAPVAMADAARARELEAQGLRHAAMVGWAEVALAEPAVAGDALHALAALADAAGYDDLFARAVDAVGLDALPDEVRDRAAYAVGVARLEAGDLAGGGDGLGAVILPGDELGPGGEDP